MQEDNLPEWAEPKVEEEYNNTNQGPPEYACEKICNPTNSGQAGKYCGCYENPDNVPISGGWVLILLSLGLGVYKLSN